MIRFIYRYTVTLFSGWHQVIVGFPPYRFQLDVLLGKIGVVSTRLRSFNYIAEAIYLIDFLGFLLLKNLSEINRENTNVKTEAGCFFMLRIPDISPGSQDTGIGRLPEAYFSAF